MSEALNGKEASMNELPNVARAPKRLLWAQKIANISDTAVRIPGVNLSIGLDSIIGLIPVVGDALMLGASLVEDAA